MSEARRQIVVLVDEIVNTYTDNLDLEFIFLRVNRGCLRKLFQKQGQRMSHCHGGQIQNRQLTATLHKPKANQSLQQCLKI